MTAARLQLGAAGEERAAAWYVAQGYAVLARNWRCKEGEIDLVCAKGRTLVICEVKTRTGDRFGSGAEAVTSGKRRRIRRLAQLWLAEFKARKDLVVRFDVISVLCRPSSEPELRHIRGAF